MVECNLAKVEVEGSNPFSRSIFSFHPHALKLRGRRRQVAKAEVCKTSIGGSNPPGASNFFNASWALGLAIEAGYRFKGYQVVH